MIRWMMRRRKVRQKEQEEYQRINVECAYSPHIFKKVTLINPIECRKITLGDLLKAWAGTGHFEWEELLVIWFDGALADAFEQGLDEADISKLFNNDLLAVGLETFRTEEIYKHLLDSGTFTVVEENEIELKLAFCCPTKN